MQPKFNKLITLLLLLGTFAFLMEAEQRLKSFARTNLSDWASLLPTENSKQIGATINPFAHKSLFASLKTTQPVDKLNTKSN